MKKLVMLLLVSALLLSLAACAGVSETASQGASVPTETAAPTAGETAAPTHTTVQPETEPPIDTAEDLPEPESGDPTVPTERTEPAEPTNEPSAEPTEPAGGPLAGSEWKAESIRDDKWVGRALSLYADGSLWYREGRTFSEYALYLDGLWQTEEDGTLDLTLWYSPYDAWDRPEDYRVSAADIPADSWTPRFSCETEGENRLTLVQKTERGFVDDEDERWIEFREAGKDIPIISPQELRALADHNSEELARLLGNREDWDLYDYGGQIRFRGIARSGSEYAAKVEYSVALTISEEELAEAARTGQITLQGQKYAYDSPPADLDESEDYYGSGRYGKIYKLDSNGAVNRDRFYLVEKIRDRYFFVFEIGGLSSRLEITMGVFWLWLDPETPVTVGPGWYEDAPGTLDEYGSVPTNAISSPYWDNDTDALAVYVDMR